jgi:hypothetical protein
MAILSARAGFAVVCGTALASLASFASCATAAARDDPFARVRDVVRVRAP